MRRYTSLWIVLLFISFDFLSGQANITAIRFGSTDDPLRGVTIAWESHGSADSIAWGYTADLEIGKSIAFISNSITGTRFEYTFPDLNSGSTVHYSIFDSNGNGWTDTRFYFTASDASEDQFSFTVLGDSRTFPEEWQTVSEAALDTDFTLFMGDIVEDGNIVSDWEAWFEFGEKFISREIVYHCVGNHDDDNSPGGFENFLGLFTQPENELYYSFTYGNAVFICLNSEKPASTDQYNWLLAELEANMDKTWKIVFFHKPYYTAPSHRYDMEPYFDTWWKAFDDYGVDMIFNGHTHNYQRTKPINRNVSINSAVEAYGSESGMGRCQIVAGNAGAPLSGAADPTLWWLDNSASKPHFCKIDIEGAKLSLKAMDADLAVFDSLILDKRSSEITFQVDLTEVTDLYEGGDVWLDFVELDSSFVMYDTLRNGIYTYTMSVAVETELKYSFVYQTGSDPDTDKISESVPVECGDAEGYRNLLVPDSSQTLPALLFGSCKEYIPFNPEITFQVDLNQVRDLFEGGAVWLTFVTRDTSYIMNDTDDDGIYAYTISAIPGTNLRYFYTYQNGADSIVDVVEETATAACSSNDGYRTLLVPQTNLILNPVLFTICEVTEVMVSTIEVSTTGGTNSVDVGDNLQMVAAITPADASDSTLTWSVDDNTIAVIDAVTGLLTGIKGGVVTITAAANDDSGVKGEIVVTVLSDATLTTLSVDIGNLNPVFDAAVYFYTVDVPEGTVSVTINATATDPNAIVTGDGVIDVSSGGGTAIIVVTGYGGTSTLTYQVKISVMSSVFVIDSSKKVNLVYPNPARGILFIDNPSADKFGYEIISMSGRVVSSKQNITGSKAEVDISGLLKGIYIIKVRFAEKPEIHKLILQ